MIRAVRKLLKNPVGQFPFPSKAFFIDQNKLFLRFYASSLKKDSEEVFVRKQFPNALKNTSFESRKIHSEIKSPKFNAQSVTEPSNGNGKKKSNIVYFIAPLVTAAILYQIWNIFIREDGGGATTDLDSKRKKRRERLSQRHPALSADIPSQVPYLLIGGGTASFAAFRAIKSKDPVAQVLVISNEPYYPYMRPPLSKEMFYDEDRNVSRNLKFKQWNGKERSLFYEHEEFYADIDKLTSSKNGGIAVAKGWTVTRIDPKSRKVYLDDGKEIAYGKCLIASGAKPKNLPIFEKSSEEIKEKVMLYRSIQDFEELEDIITEGAKTVAIIGGGFLGSELACALTRRGKSTGMKVYQIFREEGNMAHVLPKYLTKWTTNKVKEEGVNVINHSEVTKVEMKNNKVLLHLNNGQQQVEADEVVVAVGVEPNTDLAKSSGLEVDNVIGGYLVNSEMEARSNLYIAGDCASFFDERLGRRRIEHHDNAVLSGRVAGENMTGENKTYNHQSMLWSDLGPEVGYEAIGIVDSKLPTFGVYAKPEKLQQIKQINVEGEVHTSSKVKEENESDQSEDYVKGVIFYLKDNVIVGIVLWNIFSRVGIARQVLKEQKTFEDLSEVAKLFDLYAE